MKQHIVLRVLKHHLMFQPPVGFICTEQPGTSIDSSGNQPGQPCIACQVADWSQSADFEELGAQLQLMQSPVSHQ